MSRQNKQRKKAVIAKQFSPKNKGPAGTEPLHGKRKSWSQLGRKVLSSARSKSRDS